jgi:hypothetical protein
MHLHKTKYINFYLTIFFHYCVSSGFTHLCIGNLTLTRIDERPSQLFRGLHRTLALFLSLITDG